MGIQIEDIPASGTCAHKGRFVDLGLFPMCIDIKPL